MNNGLCYIIIVNYNSYLDTINCINSIFLLQYQYYNIIVVDNKSVNNSVKILKKYFNSFDSSNKHKLVFLENDKNGGYGYGVNSGIRFAMNDHDCEYLWVINNDIKMSVNCLNTLVNNSKHDNILSPGVYDYDNMSRVQSLGCIINPSTLTTKNILNMENNKIDYLSGVSLFFNRIIIDKIGLFSEKYFMYYEDVEWCTRARKNNIKLKVLGDCFVYHKNKIYISYNLKLISQFNRIKFCIDHYLYKLPFVSIIVLFSIFLKSINRFVLHKK